MYTIIALKQIPLTLHALLRQIKRLIRPKINIYELHIHRNSFHLFRMIALKSLSVRAKILEWLSICDEKQKPRRLICPCFDGKHNLPSTLPFLLVLAVWVQMFFFQFLPLSTLSWYSGTAKFKNLSGKWYLLSFVPALINSLYHYVY